MKLLRVSLAVLVAALGVFPQMPVPIPRLMAAHGPAHHGCCCPKCPGPGLCPCDSGNSTACLQVPEDRSGDIASPHALPILKLVCELPAVPPRTAGGARFEDSDRRPDLPVSADADDKVPISRA